MAPKKLSLASSLPLPSSSLRIPQLGFGVYSSPPNTCVASCTAALEAGYRHIDTAQMYGNEREVGEAVRKASSSSLHIPRSELFLTTKILRPGSKKTGSGGGTSYERIKHSVEIMDVGGYVDLFLIHSPSSGSEGRKDMWEALARAEEEGLTKAVGVSNFGIAQIEELKAWKGNWPPKVNQIELHPWCQQRETVEYCEQNGIVIEAYSPIVRNQKANNPTLKAIANTHGKTTAQVLIRYGLQKGWVPLPKSDTPNRIVENAAVYDFELTGDDIRKLDNLDQGSRGAIVMAASNR